MALTVEIAKEFNFEAAHFLPKVPKTHKCHGVHGHSYTITVRAKGTVDSEMGWFMDLSDLSKNFSPLLKELDHSLLNNIAGLSNPTSENLAAWIFMRLEQNIPELFSVTVEATNRVAVTVSRDGISSS